MIYLYKNQIYQTEPRLDLVINRATTYGDGFFETIFLVNGRPRFLDFHYQRMQQAALVFGFSNLPAFNVFAHQIERLANQLPAAVSRLKVMVWRTWGGTFKAYENTAEYLIMIDEAKLVAQSLIKMGVCTTFFKSNQPWSFAKPLSAVEYVMAGQFAKQHSFDDVLLVTLQNFVAEAVTSNVFFLIDGQWLTPPVSTGCVAGIMRKVLLTDADFAAACLQKNIHTNDLGRVEACFLSNAAGLRQVETLNGRKLNTYDSTFLMLAQKYNL